MSEATFAMNWVNQYNITWTSQSRNAGESVPVSGGDIGQNVWAEDRALLKPEVKLRVGYVLVTAAATCESWRTDTIKLLNTTRLPRATREWSSAR
jgi:hypothetical protein